jgi:hypothetical protein
LYILSNGFTKEKKPLSSSFFIYFPTFYPHRAWMISGLFLFGGCGINSLADRPLKKERAREAQQVYVGKTPIQLAEGTRHPL